jgi:hypothetical protein
VLCERHLPLNICAISSDFLNILENEFNTGLWFCLVDLEKSTGVLDALVI